MCVNMYNVCAVGAAVCVAMTIQLVLSTLINVCVSPDEILLGLRQARFFLFLCEQ